MVIILYLEEVTKRFYLAVLSIAVVACLSSCTAAGVECGLIGKWEYSDNGVTITIDIAADDKVTTTVKATVATVTTTTTSDATVKSVSDHTVTLEKDGVESKIEYKDLGCDSVKFKTVGDDWRTYKKVF